MSWRIEESDALTLLRELPAGWAQCCVTTPPQDIPVPRLLAVLGEVHRVLRPDGTLWLALTPGGNSPQVSEGLRETAWLRPATPVLHRGRIPKGVLLLTKQPDYFFNPRAVPAPDRCSMPARPPRAGRACGLCHSPRRAFCVPAGQGSGLLPREAIEWCILTSTVRRACGVCGAPWRRVPKSACSEERWRRGCVHLNGRGRALVLDPFCGSGSTGLVAQRHGRDFLGIEQNAASAALARRRLNKAERETAR